MESKTKDLEHIDQKEVEKIGRSLLLRLKAEDNSYVLSKILNLKIWSFLFRKILNFSTSISEICSLCIAIGKKWSFVPEVIENLSKFIGAHIDIKT